MNLSMFYVSLYQGGGAGSWSRGLVQGLASHINSVVQSEFLLLFALPRLITMVMAIFIVRFPHGWFAIDSADACCTFL